MVKNLKKHKREVEKSKAPGQGYELDFVPQTFMLPGEYPLFVEEFQRCPSTTWIVKPASRSQGKGIFLLSRINQLRKITLNNFSLTKTQPTLSLRENYVISKYIGNPLLIGEKKFDLRLYTLVTNYKPLQAWMFKKAFCRFCSENYSNETAEFDNMFVHLTNVAIQKNSFKYNERHGGKWPLSNLRFYVESVAGTETAQRLFSDINNIVVQSLKAVQPVMVNDPHCFELYGYDILVDSDYKPWLVEINASPSLTTTTKRDKRLKLTLLDDVFNIVMQIKRAGKDPSDLIRTGGFFLLHEDQAAVSINTGFKSRSPFKAFGRSL
eukprot:TRINITY_DN8768_c0_g6_i1.p1 TRINITY_DN8768_c0_g6~~TRINITY_DN8768_c0_g6_i1.p1  ORF type:complete len:323 (-),score=50.73 TRINITY_DN8768_c0_g6_i1:44-1012(-)